MRLYKGVGIAKWLGTWTLGQENLGSNPGEPNIGYVTLGKFIKLSPYLSFPIYKMGDKNRRAYFIY